MQVVDQSLKHLDVVARVAESLVAVEAQDAADPAGRVVMIDVLGLAVAHRTGAALRFDHRMDIGRGDPVSAAEMVVTGVAVKALNALLRHRVVARTTIGSQSVASSSVPAEHRYRLGRRTTRTVFLPVRHYATPLHDAPLRSRLLFALQAGPGIEARTAVGPTSVAILLAECEFGEGLEFSAVRTLLAPVIWTKLVH